MPHCPILFVELNPISQRISFGHDVAYSGKLQSSIQPSNHDAQSPSLVIVNIGYYYTTIQQSPDELSEVKIAQGMRSKLPNGLSYHRNSKNLLDHAMISHV